MTIPSRGKKETLSMFSEKLALYYVKNQSKTHRKQNGQFFTPITMAKYLVNLVDIDLSTDIHLLDPGSGTGIFVASFIDRLLISDKFGEIQVTCVEKEKKLFHLLTKLISECKKELNKSNINHVFNLINGDYIELDEKDGLKKGLFDIILINPPYFKINNSYRRSINQQLTHPNIYSLFLEKSLSLLKKDGQCISITPRSFCSGLYYKPFREWFISNVDITAAHLFKRRSRLFLNDGIQQEVVILKTVKNRRHRKVTITQSLNNTFEETVQIIVPKTEVEYYDNKELFIRLPSSNEELESLRTMDSWPESIQSLEFQVSTGPVVPFRCEGQLSNRKKGKNYFPLIWNNNLKQGKIVWPVKGNGKQIYIINNKKSTNVIPGNNYVLVKRLSSKEQRKRIDAVLLVDDQYLFDQIGIENHVNYIHKVNGELSTEEAVGLACILNTNLVDNYYRAINGSTQVNAYELSHLPLPSKKKILKIGKQAIKKGVFRIGINSEIVNEATITLLHS